MRESDEAPWRFSPLRVVGESLAFTAVHVREIARWALAPLVFGLGFHLYAEVRSGGDASAPAFGPLMLLALLLLWIRVPLEMRLYRLGLLGERPGAPYAQELLTGRSLRYLWAYVRMTFLFAGCVMAVTTILGSGMGLLEKDAVQPGQAMPLAFAAAVLGAMGLVYAWLAPRLLLLFPDVALGGPGRLFPAEGIPLGARRARWRILAVAALVWTPELCLNALTHAGLGGERWQAFSGSVWYVAGSFLLGLLTLVVSCVAGSRMYGLLVPGGPRPEPEPQESDED
ncbi:hypothetical protein NNJEOMEG_03885 [Fundidesulfovibrio magnetotacticus]|uniref:Uncharacterized protein n=2 Tax=Fundidesulfovibrio magnetotacticus TaxID=2730080 RepID=A0A6V8LZN6_9BACT|nr:hypothetical protein NNJEOMEG_03885 [Fundidesulfovibrio magnetotacticus]